MNNADVIAQLRGFIKTAREEEQKNRSDADRLATLREGFESAVVAISGQPCRAASDSCGPRKRWYVTDECGRREWVMALSIGEALSKAASIWPALRFVSVVAEC